MSEVLIDDSSLNAIAHSIRRKNGLLRTYKPREMAPAIRAFNDFIPDAHSFTINVQQSPNQTIRIRKYLDADYHEYTNTFTVSEPFYKLDITVEADVGYIAGQPNYESPVTVDRDMVIHASPATESDAESTTTVYFDGSQQTNLSYGFYSFYSDPECTQRVAKNQIYGKLNIMDVSDGYPYSADGLIGGHNTQIGCTNVTEIIQNIDTSKKNSLASMCYGLSNCIKMDLSNLIFSNVTSTSAMFRSCGRLESFGDISGADVQKLRSTTDMFNGCGYLKSIDLHGWYTPELRTISSMFNSCSDLRFLDISNLYTGEITDVSYAFAGCSSLKYIIMDKEEIKFDGNYMIDNPNNSVKYLVPENMVNIYKTHPNWQSRASQIDSIDNYTITRYDGQVFVTPNN